MYTHIDLHQPISLTERQNQGCVCSVMNSRSVSHSVSQSVSLPITQHTSIPASQPYTCGAEPAIRTHSSVNTPKSPHTYPLPTQTPHVGNLRSISLYVVVQAPSKRWSKLPRPKRWSKHTALFHTPSSLSNRDSGVRALIIHMRVDPARKFFQRKTRFFC